MLQICSFDRTTLCQMYQHHYKKYLTFTSDIPSHNSEYPEFIFFILNSQQLKWLSCLIGRGEILQRDLILGLQTFFGTYYKRIFTRRVKKRIRQTFVPMNEYPLMVYFNWKFWLKSWNRIKTGMSRYLLGHFMHLLFTYRDVCL